MNEQHSSLYSGSFEKESREALFKNLGLAEYESVRNRLNDADISISELQNEFSQIKREFGYNETYISNFNHSLRNLEARFEDVLKVFDMKIEEMNNRISFIRYFYKAFKIVEKVFSIFKRKKK